MVIRHLARCNATHPKATATVRVLVLPGITRIGVTASPYPNVTTFTPAREPSARTGPTWFERQPKRSIAVTPRAFSDARPQRQ